MTNWLLTSGQTQPIFSSLVKSQNGDTIERYKKNCKYLFVKFLYLCKY